MIKDFFAGACCVFTGIRAFYGDRSAWKYNILPFLSLMLIYTLLFVGVFYLSSKAGDMLIAWIERGPGWISWIASGIGGMMAFFGIMAAILMLAFTISMFYEIAGGIFFDPLAEYYEKKRFGLVAVKMSFREEMRFVWDSLLYGIHAVSVAVLLLIISFILPIIGPLVMIVGSGYMMGVSYMVCSARNRRMSIRELRDAAWRNAAAVAGFGTMAYLLLLLPFAALLVIPGLVLGGAELFHGFLGNKK